MRVVKLRDVLFVFMDVEGLLSKLISNHTRKTFFFFKFNVNYVTSEFDEEHIIY